MISVSSHEGPEFCAGNSRGHEFENDAAPVCFIRRAAIIMGRRIITAIAAALCMFPGYLHACGSMIQWKGVTVQVSCSAFQPRKHRLGYQHGALRSIDGRRYSGTDGAIPKRQIQSLRLKVDGAVYVVPDELLRTLYEPVLPPGHPDSLSVQRADDLILARFTGGAGAGAYEVMWVLNTATSQLTRLLYEQPNPEKAKMVRVQLKPDRGIHADARGDAGS